MMFDPQKAKDPYIQWVIKVANEIELNLMLDGTKWDNSETRIELITAIVMMWESIKKQDELVQE